MLAQKLLALATFVGKVEALDIHVIDAGASHFANSRLGMRVSVRGGEAALIAISDFLCDEVVVPIQAAGMIDSPLLTTTVQVDDVFIYLTAQNREH